MSMILYNNILNKISNYKHYFTELIMLAFPLFVGNMGHTLIGATDILVVAKYDINSLAAVSIANSLLFTVIILGLGISDAVSIVLSNMLGKKCGIKKYLLSTLLFSSLSGIIFTCLCLSLTAFVPKIGFDVNLTPLINEYLKIVSFSVFFMFLFQGIKGFLLAYEIVKFPNFLLLFAVILNLIFDVVLVLGFGPISPLGSKGAAIATFSVRFLMASAMFIYVFRFINFKSEISFKYMRQLLKVGFPIGLALMFEFAAFNVITILVGKESGLLAATHNILITVSSATFMVPLSVATAVSVKVAYYFGALKPLEIKRYSLSGLIIGVGFMFIVSILLALFPRSIIALFTANEDVLNVAIPVISVVAAYQVFDGMQAVFGGILKGFKMTKIVSATVIAGYWLFGMPVAFITVYKMSMSLKGYWIALAVALFFMGCVQALIAKRKYISFKNSLK